jgi:ABC-type polysaccharide/polyol phosphate transport system ATPase subunit
VVVESCNALTENDHMLQHTSLARSLFALRVITRKFHRYWLSLKNVCVDSPIYNSRGRSLKSTILAQTIGGGVADERDPNIVVIRAHVTLHLEHGALIGANLAGNVMAKIFPPSRGVADVVGRIGCLTDLNVGMDPEATGCPPRPNASRNRQVDHRQKFSIATRKVSNRHEHAETGALKRPFIQCILA